MSDITTYPRIDRALVHCPDVYHPAYDFFELLVLEHKERVFKYVALFNLWLAPFTHVHLWCANPGCAKQLIGIWRRKLTAPKQKPVISFWIDPFKTAHTQECINNAADPRTVLEGSTEDSIFPSEGHMMLLDLLWKGVTFWKALEKMKGTLPTGVVFWNKRTYEYILWSLGLNFEMNLPNAIQIDELNLFAVNNKARRDLLDATFWSAGKKREKRTWYTD